MLVVMRRGEHKAHKGDGIIGIHLHYKKGLCIGSTFLPSHHKDAIIHYFHHTLII